MYPGWGLRGTWCRYGTLMMYQGRVDGLVGGRDQSIADTLRPALQVAHAPPRVHCVRDVCACSVCARTVHGALTSPAGRAAWMPCARACVCSVCAVFVCLCVRAVCACSVCVCLPAHLYAQNVMLRVKSIPARALCSMLCGGRTLPAGPAPRAQHAGLSLQSSKTRRPV